MSLDKRLRRLRAIKDLTRAELAAKIGVSYQTITKYELGERIPGRETAEKLADVLGCTVDYILGRSDDDPALTIPLKDICYDGEDEDFIAEANFLLQPGGKITREEAQMIKNAIARVRERVIKRKEDS